MTSENSNQVIVALLMLSLISALAVVIFAGFLSLIYVRRRRSMNRIPAPASVTHDLVPASARYRPSVFENACRWVVIKGSNVGSVQSALGLHNPVPCTWDEGLTQLTPQKLFISPPVRGWILVIGQGLPDSSEDVDSCFHFIMKMSRSLGQVQFFSLNRALTQHSWIWAESGHIRRAYSWAGETLWNQGDRTGAEIELGLPCYGYGETVDPIISPSQSDLGSVATQIFLLAGRWSFDPTAINENALHLNPGVAGELIHSKPH